MGLKFRPPPPSGIQVSLAIPCYRWGGGKLDGPNSAVTKLVLRKLAEYFPHFQDFYSNFTPFSLVAPLPIERLHTPAHLAEKKRTHF